MGPDLNNANYTQSKLKETYPLLKKMKGRKTDNFTESRTDQSFEK